MLESLPVSLNLFHFHRISSISFIFFISIIFYLDSIISQCYETYICLYVYVSFKPIFSITLCVLFWVSITIHSDLFSIKIWFLLSQCSYAIQVSLTISFTLYFLYLYSISNCFKRLPFTNSIQCFFIVYFPFPISFEYYWFINITNFLLSSLITPYAFQPSPLIINIIPLKIKTELCSIGF